MIFGVIEYCKFDAIDDRSEFPATEREPHDPAVKQLCSPFDGMKFMD
jgi:hypothetical protein